MFLIIIAILLVTSRLGAQEPVPRTIEFGPAASYAIGWSAGNFPVYRGFPDCGLFSNGTLAAPRVAAVVAWPALFGGDLGIVANIGWAAASYRYRAYPNDEQRLFDPATRTLIDIDREFRYDGDMRLAELGLLLRWRLSDRWGIAAGPSGGYRYAASFEQTDNVVNPPDRSFADGERTHVMERGTILSGRQFALGGTISASFAIPLSERVHLVPELAARGDILSPVHEMSWQSISAGVGFALLYSPPPHVPEPLPPSPADTAPPPAPALRAAIRVRGIDDDDSPAREAVITIDEVIFRQHTPLLAAVYFDRNSSQVPERYRRRDRVETERFTLLDVAELGALELTHNVEDLVGYRMRNMPEAKLTLYGLMSDDEPAALAAERAGRIRDYLVDVWAVSRGRIDVRTGAGPIVRSDEATEDGRAENRRVAFASESSDLLAPLATERVLRDFNPPRIRLQPAIEAEAGIRRWGITLRQGTEVLASFEGTGGDAASPLRSNLSWRLSGEQMDSASGFLTADLFVEDSTGQRRTASDSIALILRHDSTVVAHGSEQQGELERLSYALVAFGYRSASGDREHEQRLRELAGRIHDNAQVMITGYTDRIGDDRYNIELSRGRAEYMADRLRELTAARGVTGLAFTIRGAGAETNRFPNDLPEGRVLSRGATAVVEQDAEPGGRP